MNVEVESEMWALDKRLTKKGRDINGWSAYNIFQFASAYGYTRLALWLYDKSLDEIYKLLWLCRLANYSREELAEIGGLKKTTKRPEAYKAARANYLEKFSDNG